MKAYPMKARIRNEGTGPARVDIYDDIGGGGWFFGGISASDVAGQLQGLKGPLDVHISSSGGDVFDGLAIAEAIRSYPGQVTAYVDGIAASIASVIAQAGQQRVMAPGSMLMIHDAWGYPDEPNEAGLLKMAATLGKISDNLAQQYAARAGGTPGQWREAMQAETWYTADEAVAAGLADSVSGAPAELPQSLDVDALAARAPARIMAALRTLPRAAAPAEPDGGGGDKPACKTCDGKGRLPHPGTGKAGVKCPGCAGTGTYDPDTATGDDDEPDEGMEIDALTEAQVLAIVRRELVAASLVPGPDGFFRPAAAAGKVDESPWDGGKAMANGAAADDPAAFYAGICAGEKAGDKSTQGAWALPYKYHPDDPPNAAGVKAALGRLPQTEGLTNEAEAKKTLQAAMKTVNPDWEPEDSTEKSVFSRRLEQMRGALPPLRGAEA